MAAQLQLAIRWALLVRVYQYKYVDLLRIEIQGGIKNQVKCNKMEKLCNESDSDFLKKFVSVIFTKG